MSCKPTGHLLKQLRALMAGGDTNLQAYIVPTEDAHQSEYVANCDKRRAFISGFDGSAGTAIITPGKAALWTDGRYHLQATTQMDENWTLMKSGLADTPSSENWLKQELGENARVGIDPYVISAPRFLDLNKSLKSNKIQLTSVTCNLVDNVWKERPEFPNNPIFPLALEFTGESWQDKVKRVREEMEEKQCQLKILSALDSIAWTLNLRGSDIPFNPVFFSYLFLTRQRVFFFVEHSRFVPDIEQHLNLSCADNKIIVLPYSQAEEKLRELSTDPAITKVWISSDISYGLYKCIPEEKTVILPDCVQRMKAIKNEVEIDCMRRSHLRDAIAVCEYVRWLEESVKRGEKVTEISGADKLEQFRKEQAHFVSLSFETISGSGPHGAIIHYRCTPETDRAITDKELYLVDSGAQYTDGTTDITRTVHLGQPSEKEIEMFTLVLKGHISLARIVFPDNVGGERLDTLARQPLWQVGLDYLHGTGHGVGMFLNVHEGPCGIGTRMREDGGLSPGMILSNEPGFYEDGSFGIRIESLQLVVPKQTLYTFQDRKFVTFDPITLVPIQRKLINTHLLTGEEIAWLNEYHKTCLERLGALMKEQNRLKLYHWLVENCQSV
ncbi:hypothetical protein LOD99_217 [Oopsacas minuta]|uniref:Xaa-Pro aminopeptidase 1 n=1 Tax=Oopsacas minuta TaxID=111878 RepID=A0AAV7K838_9METZ|nr:hypothetical protein LOD99_217 [Oopsacas minuta]